MPKTQQSEKSYFGKSDVHKRKRIASARRDEMEKKRKDELKALHWRHCAECGFELESAPFKGATVFKCDNCGGVFLTKDAFRKLCGCDSHVVETMIDMLKF